MIVFAVVSRCYFVVVVILVIVIVIVVGIMVVPGGIHLPAIIFGSSRYPPSGNRIWDDEDPTAALDPASGPDAPASSSRGSGLAFSGAGLAALEEFSDDYEAVFGDVASGSEELLAGPPPARRPRLSRRLVYMTEADIRAAGEVLASLGREPLRPPSDCGDGSLEEELAIYRENMGSLSIIY